jgi:hypothetical protein
MVIIGQNYMISEMVEERRRCGCIAGEEDKLCWQPGGGVHINLPVA